MTSSISAGELAKLVEPHTVDGLIGFDVDGVLSPIVLHADDSVLTPGVIESLGRLANNSNVVILSGRSLESLERLFSFPEGLQVIGSHGLEVRGAGDIALDDHERYTYDQLEILGTKTVEAIGEGAWLERKPASLVVHSRAADPGLAQPAMHVLKNLANMLDGAQVKTGHSIVELLARGASKGEALMALAARLGSRSVVFFGDDVTDEDAFRLMGSGDVSVRVGPGDSAAKYRLHGPDDVAKMLTHLT